MQPNVVTTFALRSFFSCIFSSLQQSVFECRLWYELVDRSSFACPDSFSIAISHIHKNLSYFRLNYATLLAIVVFFSHFSHPVSFAILLCLLATWIFLYLFRPSDQPLIIVDCTFSNLKTLVILVFSTIIVVFLTNIGSLMIYANLIRLMILCFHGAFRVPEDYS